MKKFLSVFAAFTMTAALVPCAAFAVQEHGNEVHVIVENTTFTPDSEDWDDEFWYGTLVDTWVTIDNDSTAISCIVDALDSEGCEQTGAENNYIDSIDGLKAFDGGSMSGWMGTLNDWFANEGFGAFTVENGKLESGDEIRMMYTCDWGADLGSDWSNNDTTIKNITFSKGTLDVEFDKDVHDYTLNIPETVDSIKITPTASNKNYQVRTRIGDTVYKRTENVPVNDSDIIYIECNFEGAVSMNSDGEPQTYTFNVKKVPNEAQSVSAVLTASLTKLASSVPEPAFGSVGGEWTVLSLARGGHFDLDNPYFTAYYDRITDTVNETAASVNMNGALHKVKSTENSRLLMALSSIGKDAKVGDWDLTAPYENFDWIKGQGLNGPVWALIALDTHNYLADSDIRQQCIDYILDNQVENGGWSFGGKTADPDMTSMTLIAISNYTENADVKAAVDKAVEALSAAQRDSGGYAAWGSESSESISQVITALSTLGINPDTDTRFIKNGNSLVDALLAYYDADTQDFKHVLSGSGNAMATDQALYALVAYDRLLSGKPALYDMSDVDFGETPAVPPVTTTTTTTTATTTMTTTTTDTNTSTTTSTATTTVTTVSNTTSSSTTTETGTLPNTGKTDPTMLFVCVFAFGMVIAGAFVTAISMKKDEEV